MMKNQIKRNQSKTNTEALMQAVLKKAFEE